MGDHDMKLPPVQEALLHDDEVRVRRARPASLIALQMLQAEGKVAPTEHLFAHALESACEVAGVGLRHLSSEHPGGGKQLVAGMAGGPTAVLVRQAHVRCYRADFLLRFASGSSKAPPIVVEIDGTSIHYADPAKVAADRRRDRDMAAIGFLVMRFPNVEVEADPLGCARFVVQAGVGLCDAKGG